MTPTDPDALAKAVSVLVCIVALWGVGGSVLAYLAVRILGTEMQVAALRIVQALREKGGEQ